MEHFPYVKFPWYRSLYFLKLVVKSNKNSDDAMDYVEETYGATTSKQEKTRSVSIHIKEGEKKLVFPAYVNGRTWSNQV